MTTPGAVLLAGALLASAALAGTGPGMTGAGTAGTAANQPAAAAQPKASSYHRARVPTRAKDYYVSIWGVDDFLVRETASGNLIRFSYRVVDPARAKALGDDRNTPYLVGLRAHAMLQIPAMENIGKLRQTGTPEAGQEYWMVFSNKGYLVKPGDRVTVVIGSFHADGLVVQ